MRTGERPRAGLPPLGLRMGRVGDGFVDCWFGDAELKEQVDAEPAPDPADLARQSAG
ncbi:hypothetical protein ACRAKI_18220 [Saccharothrix isguenensis]